MSSVDLAAQRSFSAETYHALFESAPDAVLVIDAGTIIAANPQAERMFGYTAQELLGARIEELIPERFHGAHPRHRAGYIADPAPRPMGSGLELWGRHKSGTEFPVEISLSPLRHRDRVLVSAAVRDVTDRKRVQDELRRARDELEDRVRERTAELAAQIVQRDQAHEQLRRQAEMLDLVSEPIFAWDWEQGIVFWNKAATETYGFTEKETLGRESHELLATAHPKGIPLIRETLSQEGRWSGELLHTTRDGRRIAMESRMALLSTPDGERLVLESCRDITGRRAAEDALRQAQKMEAVGQLTGGIAHDFNNLLTIILANLQLLDDELIPTSARELADSATRAALRGAELTRKLLVFARRQRLEPTSLDVNKLVSSMSGMLVRILGAHISVVETLTPALPDALVDAGQLETALLNLALNARDAMPQGGRLDIQTSELIIEDTIPPTEGRLAPGSYVIVAVTDTGSGMSPDVAARAFEPFFTTKEAGKGTGLGLSMVYGFAKQSGGHVNLYSDVARGTTVTLYLPQAKGFELAAGPPSHTMQRGTEAVLLVEDDYEVRAATSGMLSVLGYKVVEAQDATSALALLEARGEIGLLFTDVVLAQGMSGPELAAKARQFRPGLKVLFMSGYVRDTVAFHEQLERDAQFLGKPFRKEELARKVRLALDDGEELSPVTVSADRGANSLRQ
jgi:PAS domain S-box-containing protein